MLKLGIIGAENSHSWAIGKLCNIDKAVPVQASLIWGETPELAAAAAQKGGIPGTVKDWRELLGQVDGVMIDHRHPAGHFEPAKFFLEKGVPTFVDKPFTFSVREARELLDLAEAKGTPIVTFSAIPIQPAFAAFRERFAAITPRVLNTTGPVDIDSKYGGIFFYGIHQIDSIVELLGTRARKAQFLRNGANGVATILFEDDVVATMNCIPGGAFHWMACGAKETITHTDQREANPYMPSVRIIHEFLSSRKTPYSRARMLAPVAILEALAESLKTGSVVDVASVN